MTLSALSTLNGPVEFEPAPSGRTRVTLRPAPEASNDYIPRLSCETSHPEEVPLFLEHGVSFHWLCDAISRVEDPDYVLGVIQHQLFSFCHPHEFRGARVLDFGCGTGASTLGMAALLPESQVIGVELDPDLVTLGKRLAANRCLSNITFETSPTGDALPKDLGSFDYIMLSAVFEHLLPLERRLLMPQLWDSLQRGGVLFVNQTPHRWFPCDTHSTGLWAINYLPDRLAHWYARRFASMNSSINRSMEWNVHLRGGLRGGSERELMRLLTADDRAPGAIMQPVASGLRDRAEYWLSSTSARFRSAKKMITVLYRLTDYLFGTVPSVNLEVAIRKDDRGHNRPAKRCGRVTSSARQRRHHFRLAALSCSRDLIGIRGFASGPSRRIEAEALMRITGRSNADEASDPDAGASDQAWAAT
jgi:SAM-dependent methyltransferase